MNVNIDDDLVRVVILDISSIYVQIYNQGYFNKNLLLVLNKNILIQNIGDE